MTITDTHHSDASPSIDLGILFVFFWPACTLKEYLGNFRSFFFRRTPEK
jgi:hypothetical protein